MMELGSATHSLGEKLYLCSDSVAMNDGLCGLGKVASGSGLELV